METYVFKFSADDLRKIDSRVLGFLISSGHCCNELSAMMPFIAFEQSLQGANEVESALILARRYTIDRIIISKIVEYRILCEKFVGHQREVSSSFISSLKSDYEATVRVLAVPKWAKILRNKVSFHYDEKYALESLAELGRVLINRTLMCLRHVRYPPCCSLRQGIASSSKSARFGSEGDMRARTKGYFSPSMR